MESNGFAVVGRGLFGVKFDLNWLRELHTVQSAKIQWKIQLKYMNYCIMYGCGAFLVVVSSLTMGRKLTALLVDRR